LDDYLKKTNPDGKVHHFLDNTLRVKDYLKPRAGTKSFVSTKNVLVVHNHFPLKCVKGNCRNYQIDLKDGHLAHYRNKCAGDLNATDCKKAGIDKAVNDTTLWKFNNEIIENVENQVKKIEKFEIENLD
jgi:hypothetical protein